jgi:hypothetical protein
MMQKYGSHIGKWKRCRRRQRPPKKPWPREAPPVGVKPPRRTLVQKALFLEEIQTECDHLMTELSPEDQKKLQFKIEWGLQSEDGIKVMIDMEISRRFQILREMRDLMPEAIDREDSSDMIDY